MGENIVSIKWKPQSRGRGGVWEEQRVGSRPSSRGHSSITSSPQVEGDGFQTVQTSQDRQQEATQPTSLRSWRSRALHTGTQGPLHTLAKTVLTPGQQQGTSGQNNSGSCLLPRTLEPATCPWERGSMHIPMSGISKAPVPQHTTWMRDVCHLNMLLNLWV